MSSFENDCEIVSVAPRPKFLLLEIGACRWAHAVPPPEAIVEFGSLFDLDRAEAQAAHYIPEPGLGEVSGIFHTRQRDDKKETGEGCTFTHP